MLLALTLVYLVIQNLVAAGSVVALGLPKGITAVVGSASLIGGHGTTIAWAPMITERFGLSNALEVGIATATLGLVIASFVGGPIAGFLIRRHHLSGPPVPDPVVGLPDDPDEASVDDLSHVGLLRTILVLNVVILIGYALEEVVAETGIKSFFIDIANAVAIGFLVRDVAKRALDPRLPLRPGYVQFPCGLTQGPTRNAFLRACKLVARYSAGEIGSTWCRSRSLPRYRPAGGGAADQG